MEAQIAEVVPRWQSFTNGPQRICQHATVSYRSLTGDTTYLLSIAGADESFRPLSRVDRYNPLTKTWQARARLPVARTLIGCEVVVGKIYVAGGYSNGFVASNRLDVYDPYLNTWQSAPSLPLAVGDCATAVVGDSLLYIIGGTSVNGTYDHNSVQVYNTHTATWRIATAKPGSPGGGIRGAGISGGRVVVAGGYNQDTRQATAETWLGTITPQNSAQITWTALPDNPAGSFSRMAAIASPLPAETSHVYFVGGDPTGQGLAVLDQVWAVNVDARAWIPKPAKQLAVSNITSWAAITRRDSVLLVVGGGFDGQNLTAAYESLLIGKRAVPLPVQVVSFTALQRNQQAILQWRTVQEVSNAGFLIEASADGQYFSPIATVPPQSTPTGPKDYQWRESLPNTELVRYYRLWQQDWSGEKHLIGLRVLQASTPSLLLDIIPNPFYTESKLVLTGFAAGQLVQIVLTDQIGRQQILHKRTVNTSSLVLPLPTTLSPGLYNIQAHVGQQVIHKRLTKN